MQYLKAGDRAQRSVVEHYYKTQHKAKMPRQPGIRQLAVVLTIADSPKIVQSGRIIKCPRKRHNCALSTLTIRPGWLSQIIVHFCEHDRLNSWLAGEIGMDKGEVDRSHLAEVNWAELSSANSRQAVNLTIPPSWLLEGSDHLASPSKKGWFWQISQSSEVTYRHRTLMIRPTHFSLQALTCHWLSTWEPKVAVPELLV